MRILCCLIVMSLMVMPLLAGCSSGDTTNGTGQTQTSGSTDTPKVVIGTMITEDFLPMWVAEKEGVFTQEGIDVQLVTFQSAQELTTALTAGEIDMAMTDPFVAATLTAGGTPVTLEWVTLGETPQQGRFGIMASPDSGVKTLKDLAGKPIGVASNTMLEYLMDNLMEQAGVPDDQIVKEEIKKIPVRYEMMTSNQVAAAVLPASLLNLGEKTGMVLVADDTQGPKNLSQSVMVARNDFAATEAGQQAIALVQASWDKAAQMVNDNGAAYRDLLVEKASLPDVIAADYPISDYPMAKRPTSEMIDPELAWMLAKGYLDKPMTYDPNTGEYQQ